MKNFSTIIIGCAFLIVAIVGAIIGWTVLDRQRKASDEAQYQQYVQKYRTQQTGKPSPAPTGASPGVTAAGLNTELQSLQDDGGATDFNQIQADVNSL